MVNVLYDTFASSGATLKRNNNLSIDVGVNGRGGIYVGGVSWGFFSTFLLVNFAIMLCAIGWNFCSWVVEYEGFMFGWSGRGYFIYDVLAYIVVLHMAVAITLVHSWHGRVDVRYVTVVNIVYGMIFAWLISGIMLVAVAWIYIVSFVSWRLEFNKTKGQTGIKRTIVGSVFIIGFVYWAPIVNGFPVVVLLGAHKLFGGSRRSNKFLYADQSLVKVNNNRANRRRTEDEIFANNIVSVSLDYVPPEILFLVTHVPRTTKDSAEFRRWAQLGDTVLQYCVVLNGMEQGLTVEQISDWKKCLNRRSMSAIVTRVGGSQERMRGANGVFASQTAAECVEAIVGVSYHYAYRDGLEAGWKEVLMSFVKEKLLFHI